MALIDVSDVVSDLSENYVTRIRQTGSYVDGVWVANPDQTDQFWACVRPIDGRTRDALPEGVRTLARWVLHGLVDIKTTVAGSAEYGDRIVFNGRTYVAISIDDSFNTHGQYTKVALTELQN